MDSGANGGAGASSTISNAVSGTTTGGTLTLGETANGGNGGNSSGGGVGGAAGSANASLTFNDVTANTIQAGTFNGTVTATAATPAMVRPAWPGAAAHRRLS